MHNLTILLPLFILLSFPNPTHSSQQCINYLQQLHSQSLLNPIQFLHTMTPYLVLSGKSIDDLGFPGSCQDDKKGYKYSTVEVSIQTDRVIYTGYLGFCFVGMCGVDDLNAFAEFIVDFIFQEYESGVVTGKFIQPPLQLQFSPIALIMCLLFLIPITISMLHPISTWLNLCKKSPLSLSDQPPKSLYIDLQNPSIEYDDDQITSQSPILQKLSLHYKWRQLWIEERSQKIFEFSLFRIIAVPIIIYGQIFWLTNFGAYNYYAFYEEIYEQFYVKLAMFGYYMPDLFLFISGFLFCRKLLTKSTVTPYNTLLSCTLSKLLRLYPLYISIFLIYWLISPALHCGPVWYIYQQEAQICNTAWWRVLLMIDNWWAQGCYPVLWFVQVQVQCLLISIVGFYLLYFWSQKIGTISLVVMMMAAFGVMVGLEPEMLVSVEIAINSYTQLYFKSLYSHIFFYLVGILFALLSNKQSIRIWLQTHIFDKPILSIILYILSITSTLTILFRPWTWTSSSTALSAQLSLCRLGILLSFIILTLKGMFIKQNNISIVHKYGYYMYPVVLVGYMITQSSFWSVGSFMYVSGYDMLNLMVPNFLISWAVGIGIGLIFDFRNLRVE